MPKLDTTSQLSQSEFPPGQLADAATAGGKVSSPAQGIDDDERIDLRRYAEVLRKRFWLVLIVATVSTAIAFGWTLRQPKIYRASATIIIDTQTANVLGRQVSDVVQLGTGGYWGDTAFFNKEYTVIRSRAVARRAADKLNLIHDDVRNGLAAVVSTNERLSSG